MAEKHKICKTPSVAVFCAGRGSKHPDSLPLNLDPVLYCSYVFQRPLAFVFIPGNRCHGFCHTVWDFPHIKPTHSRGSHEHLLDSGTGDTPAYCLPRTTLGQYTAHNIMSLCFDTSFLQVRHFESFLWRILVITGWFRLIRSLSSATFSFELSGFSN